MKKAKESTLSRKKQEHQFNMKAKIAKYLRHWPWFLIGAIVAIALSFLYLRFTPVNYVTTAKIKIMDISPELNIATDPVYLQPQTSINLDSEREVLKSSRILNQVVEDLQLDVDILEVGNIRAHSVWNSPFLITKDRSADSITVSQTYSLKISSSKFIIKDQSNKTYQQDLNGEQNTYGLPFTVTYVDMEPAELHKDREFEIVIKPKTRAVSELEGSLGIEPTYRGGNMLTLSMVGQNKVRSETILNSLIDKYDKDGILDRKAISQRTVNFIDNRLVFLTEELDSIEGSKKSFKERSSLAYIEADAGATLERKSLSEEELHKIQTQVALSGLLKESLISEAEYNLLPADIGLDNAGINNLVNDYNKMVLEREKLMGSAGSNNPMLKLLSAQLQQGKENVVHTVNMYQQQLKVSLGQKGRERNLAGAIYSSLPEKEQILRSIERQQGIKENLFLLLLQKREEAAINLAITAPSLKVVDYAISKNAPVSPNRRKVMTLFVFGGLFLPFVVLYTKFSLDTKVENRADVDKFISEVPILTEIPRVQDTKTLLTGKDHSLLAESFRILSTNIKFMLPRNQEGAGHVIFVTSSVKGEGKTLMSINLALAYASMKKSVLVIGADLRNPNLHDYFGQKRNIIGLSNYLYDPILDWQDYIHKVEIGPESLSVCYAGEIPPNAPELLSNHNFETFLEKAKEKFDYVIVDTAPTLLVTDTLLISQHADLTLYVVRAGYTEKRLLEFSKELATSEKLRNMAYVINDVPSGNISGYNYGYGYGYNAPNNSNTWYSNIFNFKRT